jgi:2-C-methyl-D-erythritol 2,4-cyclodiphosphate synthase
LADLRIGTAVDAHRLALGRRLVLGGVEFDSDRGLDGHSDADVVCHVLCDASLGAAGAGDIGRLFPGTDEWRDASSLELLGIVWERLAGDGWELVNADCMVIAQAPPIAPHANEMAARVASAMRAGPDRVSVRGTSTDGLGFTGRGEGIAAQAVVLISRPGSG